MEKTDEARVATVCIRGSPPRSRRETPARLDLLRAVADQIRRRARREPRWRGLDALIFPGGYFRLARNAGCAGLRARVEVLDEAGLVAPLQEIARSMEGSPQICLVGGADGPDADQGRGANAPSGGDQLCVAWRAAGVVGIGRKIFPVWEAYPKSRDYEGDRYVCCAQDYGTDDRMVALRSGRTAVLCACYDMFGVADCAAKADTRKRKIQHLGTSAGILHREAASPATGDGGAFARALDDCLDRWRGLLARPSVSVALVAVHEFPGTSSSFWQRHGVAGASAALGGGLAICAAHFGTLPSAWNRSTLAARDVPRRHLRQGQDRRAHSLAPVDGFDVADARGAAAGLVRLYA